MVSPSLAGVGVLDGERAIAQQHLDPRSLALRRDSGPEVPAPFRFKKDEVPEGQLAFELLRMLTGRLGQEPGADAAEPGADGAQPSERDAQPNEGDKPSDEDAPGGRGSRPNRERRGRGLRRKIEEVKVEEPEVPHVSVLHQAAG